MARQKIGAGYQNRTDDSNLEGWRITIIQIPRKCAHRVCIPSPQAGLALPIIITSTIGGFFCLCTSYSPRENKRTVKRKLNNTDRIELSLLVRVIVYPIGYETLCLGLPLHHVLKRKLQCMVINPHGISSLRALYTFLTP